jgi:hypothetical protein
MNTATDIWTRRSRSDDTTIVEWRAGGRSYSRHFIGAPRAKRFADGLSAGRIQQNSAGRIRYRVAGRNGAEMFVSVPS